MKNYYAMELEYLRELGAEYAREHPAIAPLLASRSTDPDVERLLEGTAFLCGLINERLDQNFPEIVQGLLDLTAPDMLRPGPSRTLVQFSPDPQVRGTQHLAAGTALASIPVSGVSCPYTLPRAMPVLPVTTAVTRLEDVTPDAATLRLTLLCSGELAGWWPSSLRLHLHDEFARACQWFHLLLRHCRGITVQAGLTSLSLPGTALQPDLHPGHPAEAFLSGTASGHSLLDCEYLKNYFLLPEQFLFLRLTGLDGLQRAEAARQVEVRFHLRGRMDLPRRVPDDLVRCNVSPAINLFPCSSDPFILTQNRQEYRLSPQKDRGRQLEIYAVRRLSGLKKGHRPHPYEPYGTFRPEGDRGIYTVRRARSPVNGRTDHHVCLLHTDGQGPEAGETLASDLLCFHHSLPLQLREGDISQPTDSSPAMASFGNILPPTAPMPAPDNTDLLWRLFSCLHANMLPLANREALQEFLTLCLPTQDPDPTHRTLNLQRIEAVDDFAAHPEERLFRGRPLRGQHLVLTLKDEGFAGQGERFLFGLVLDQVLAQYATINTYTRLEVRTRGTGETLAWTPRLGNRRLL